MNYTNSEFYKLTEQQKTFVTIFKGWRFPSAENVDPIEVFNKLVSKYPNQNHIKRLKDIDVWLRKNRDIERYLPNPNQWIEFLDRMFRTSNNPKRAEIQKIPYYYAKLLDLEINNPYLIEGKLERCSFMDQKVSKLLKWLKSDHITEAKVRGIKKGSYPETVDFVENFVLRWNGPTRNDMPIRADLNKKIKALVTTGVSRKLMQYLSVCCYPLAEIIADWQYPPSEDTCYQKGNMLFDGRNNKRLNKKPVNLAAELGHSIRRF
tara:strand:- start:251 stop:1039 length:789 start_codon:yes stop_codon:yes gene_type:complete